MKRSIFKKIVLTSSTISLFIVFVFSGNLFAQNLRGGLNFIISNPQGEFADNVKNTGFGAAIDFGWHPGDSPFVIGADISFINYGHDHRHEPFSSTIPDVTVKVTNSNNILLFDMFLGVEPMYGTVRPYFGGMMGFSYLFTNTSIRSENDLEEIASSTNLDDLAFNYGPAGGVRFKVWENDEADGTEITVRDVLIDVGFKYLIGSEADYLKEGSIRRSGGRVVYDINRSRTNLLIFKIGVSLSF